MGITISAVQGFSGSGAVPYGKVLVTLFYFWAHVCVTSLLGYQTKQNVAARSGERNENFAICKYCKTL